MCHLPIWRAFLDCMILLLLLSLQKRGKCHCNASIQKQSVSRIKPLPSLKIKAQIFIFFSFRISPLRLRMCQWVQSILHQFNLMVVSTCKTNFFLASCITIFLWKMIGILLLFPVLVKVIWMVSCDLIRLTEWFLVSSEWSNSIYYTGIISVSVNNWN